MRILHVTTFLQGGAGRAITDLALAEHAAGDTVHVAVDSGGVEGYGNYPEYLEALAAAGVSVLELTSTFTRALPLNCGAAAQLRGALDLDALDIVHAHAAVPAMVAALAVASAGRRIPIVQTMHGWGVRKTAEQSAADVAMMNLVDRVAVPSLTALRQMQALGVDPARLTQIPYGIADARTDALPADDVLALARLRERAAFVISCIGTIGERKNQRLVIDALARVSEAVGCVFVGDGDAAGIESYASEKGVSDRVLVLGYRPHASRYLRQTDACVLASRSEGQPLTILEAFRDGVPVIAAATEELSELVADGVTGRLFAPDDAAQLASAIVQASSCDPRAIVDRARGRFEATHSMAAMVAAYALEYARCLTPPASRLRAAS